MTLATSLPEGFYREAAPTPVDAPRLVAANTALARELGLSEGWLHSAEALAAFSGNGPWPGQQPVSLAYSGHQFGNWSPILGDGRAHLIATIETPLGVREIQLKGSGPTPFSRNGDGRAALGPMLREYVISEAMAGLGIPTTRCLAVVTTGEQVYRRRKEPGAIVVRVATSHVRVGTFQYAAAHRGADPVRTLINHEIARSHPHLAKDDTIGLLRSTISRQANLIAKWMSVGFIHGVMNTDNMSISGETIDYGPCAFIDRFHPKKVFSSIDQFGRYAWDQQPAIGLWNLTRFAESLLSALHENQDTAVELAKTELAEFYPQFEDEFEMLMMAKLGIPAKKLEDGAFIADTLKVMMDEGFDFTLFFRGLTISEKSFDQNIILPQYIPKFQSHEWTQTWKNRTAGLPDTALMADRNPVYIARNHQVEAALAEAEFGNLTRFETLCTLLRTPFAEQPNMAGFEMAPLAEEEVQATFCGT